MTRLPLARSLVVALIGVSVALAITAALAVAGLYQSRQDYEEVLARTFTVEVAEANLLAAGVVEEAVLRTGGDRAARRRAAQNFAVAAEGARAAVDGDPESAELIDAQVLAQARARRTRGSARTVELRLSRQVAATISDRQRTRREAAREEARDDSRRATVTAGIAGGLALLASLGLVAALIGSVRRPLEALVRATRFVARGDVRVHVREEGPAELRELAGSFNTMAGDLAGAREQIEAERRRLATVVESLGDALVVAGIDGRVAQTNPRAAVLVPEITVGGNAQAGDSPLPMLSDALDHEVEIEHRDRTLAVTAAHLGDGGADGVVWTIRDVSERARLERAKSEFVATASHELRSPLTSIKGFAELLVRSPDLSDRQREFAETVVLSTNRLVDLVNDLLDVTRIEAGHLELQRRPTQLGDVVDEIARLMRPRIDDKGQTLETRYAPASPAALADPARVRQIVTNLVTNAHLYTPEGGTIEVRVGADGGMVNLEVADDGPGMDPAQLENIFDRFYRGSEGQGKQPGTGLGLSIVKSLVDMHHGSIDVASAPGVGTTFTVRFPRAPASADVPSPRMALQGKRVLVIEDEPEIAALIVEQLAPHAVETVVVPSGEAALERLRQDPERFDAITLDILLAGMTGFEVLRAVRAEPALRRIPVVIVSVLAGKEALSGEWVVPKPIDEDELVDALGAAMLAGRSRILVVARAGVRDQLGPALDRIGVEYDWATNGAQAARLCEERRFEVALVDAGLRSPQAVLEQLDLRGRRVRPTVVVFAAEDTAQSFARLDAKPVSLEDATTAVLAALATAEEAASAAPDPG